METQNRFIKSRPVLQIVIGALVIFLYFSVVVYSKKVEESVDSDNKTEDPALSQIPETVTENLPSVLNEESTTYKNGTYTATGVYASPGGREQLKVTLTLRNGLIIASSLVSTPSNPTSEEFQKEFSGEYKQFVVGKDIATLSVGKVAGSSLTGVGFNSAIEQIRAQAEL